MADRTSIEWTDATWNPIRARNLETGGVGHICIHASEGCRFCYSERAQKRFRNPVRFVAQDRDKVELFLDEQVLTQPLRWQRPRMIFPCSMTDLFGEFVPDEWLDRIFAVMTLSPQHIYQPLTKRTGRAREYMAAIAAETEAAGEEPTYPPRRFDQIACDLTQSPCAAGLIEERPWPLPNVWLGTSVEDQKNADERRPHLRAIAENGWRTWVSYEPALGPVDWTDWEFIRWLVAGGESGDRARPPHPEWFRHARDWCARHGVPFLFKQWGEWLPDRLFFDNPDKRGLFMKPDGTTPSPSMALEDIAAIADDPEWQHLSFVGKKAAGRLLDGVVHDGFPTLPSSSGLTRGSVEDGHGSGAKA